MIKIKLDKTIGCPRDQLVAIMLQHQQLNRFFNAKFFQTRDAHPSEPLGGRGAIRQITMRGQCFFEEIIQATDSKISYRIIGQGPVSNHQGDIVFSDKGDATHIDYTISCNAPWWQPDFLVGALIKRDIANGLTKLARYCDER